MDRDIDIAFAAPPFEEDLEGLWDMPLLGVERRILIAAFARDGELREDVEHLLRRLDARLRGVFVLAFVTELAGQNPPARPAGAYLPALGATIAVALDGPSDASGSR